MTNAELVRRYVAALIDNNADVLSAIRARQWTVSWPQSGELVRGTENEQAIKVNYPGGAPTFAPRGRLIGSEDRWAFSPLGVPYRVAGEGESFWADWEITYPDGRRYFAVILIELRDDQVWRETQYWAECFDPPKWRAEWVEPFAPEP